MSPKLIACPNCAAHMFAHAKCCPNCSTCARGTLKKTAGAALLGLALAGGTGCDDGNDPDDFAQPDYGVALTDEDGDGYFAQEDDCDDSDDTIHPDAEETADDGVDSNCDGEDNT
jgi:hypothetical protein